MKIAIPSYGKDLNSRVFEHFGRAPYYIIVEIDPEKKEIISVSALENPLIEEHMPEQIPALLAENKINVLIAMGVGRRARSFFEEYGISVITGAEGLIKDIIDKYLKGELRSIPYEPKEKWHERKERRYG